MAVRAHVSLKTEGKVTSYIMTYVSYGQAAKVSALTIKLCTTEMLINYASIVTIDRHDYTDGNSGGYERDSS